MQEATIGPQRRSQAQVPQVFEICCIVLRHSKLKLSQHKDMHQLIACSYCKGFGHTKASCLKLLTKSTHFDASQNICRDFNRFKSSSCQNQDDPSICQYKRERKCSICLEKGCKAYNHIQGFQEKFDSNLTKKILSFVQRAIKETLHTELKANVKQTTTTEVQTEVPSNISNEQKDVQSPTPEPLQLPNNTCMTIPVVSASDTVDMAVSTGFPLSAVSEKHARNVVAAKTPYRKDFALVTAKLTTTDSALLQLKEPIEVPTTFPNGQSYRFEMVVVQELPYDIIFGFNHLQTTDAEINYSDSAITFGHVDMNFTVKFKKKSPSANTVVALTSAFN